MVGLSRFIRLPEGFYVVYEYKIIVFGQLSGSCLGAVSCDDGVR